MEGLAADNRSKGRRLARIAAWCVVAVMLLGCVVAIALHTPTGRQRAFAYARQLLEQQQIELNVDDLRYNLLDLSFAVHGLRVRSTAAASNPPLISVERATLNLGLWALIRGRYIVESADLTGVEVNYVVDESGQHNLPPSSGSETSGEPLDYLVTQLAVTNARVHYQDRQQGVDALLPISSLTVTGHALSGRHAIAIDAPGGRVRVQEYVIPLDMVSGRLDLGPDDVRVERAALTASGSEVTITGSITDFANPRLDLQSRARIDLPSLGSIAARPERVAGQMELESHVVGSAGTLVAKGRIAGRDLAFQEFEHLDVDVRAAFDQQAVQARVDELRVQAPWGRVTGDGAASFDESGETRVHVSSEALDLGVIANAAGFTPRAATRVDADLEASWQGTSYRRASGTLRAELTPTAARAARGVIPIGGRITATARTGDVDVQLDRVRTTGLEAGGRVRLAASDEIAGAVQLRVREIADAAAAVNAFSSPPDDPLVPVTVSGTAVIDAKLAGTLQAPTAAIALQAHGVSIDDITDVDVAGNVTYSPVAVVVHTADVQWAKAWAHTSGSIGLSQPRRLDFAVTADSLELATLLVAAGRTDVPVNGVVGLDSRIGGTVSSPMASIDLRAGELAAYGETLGQASMTAGMADRELSVTRLLLEKPQQNGVGRLEVFARYHLDRQSYTFAVQSDQLQLENLSLAEGTLLSGAVAVEGSGTGTISQPSGRLDVALEGLTYGGDELGAVRVRTVVADQQASITANADRFATTLDAVVAVSEPYAYTLTGRVDGMGFDRLPLHLETPLTGRTSATIGASGELTRARESRASVSIEELSGTWNGQAFGVNGPAALRYQDERLAIDWLEVGAQDSTLSVYGTLPLNANAGDGALDIDSRLSIGTLVGYVPSDTGLVGEGTLAITGHVSGTLEAIDPRLSVVIENGLLLSPSLEPGITNLSAHATVADGVAALDVLTASWGTAQLSASARVPLAVVPELPISLPQETGAAALAATVTNLELATLPGVPEGLHGQIAVEANASGTNVSDLSAISGRVAFPQLALGFRELTLEQSQPVAISFQNGLATIEQLELAGSVGHLSAQGAIGLTGERGLNVTTNGAIDLGVLATFTDVARAEGATRFAVAARGTTENPDVSGTVEIAGGNVAISEPRVGAENLEARVTLAGTRVTLESLSGNLNGGTLSGSGVLAYIEGDIRELDIQIATTDFAFDAPLDLRSQSDSTLRISRRGEEIVLDGQITIKDAGLTGDVNFDTGLLAAMTAPRQLDLTEKRSPLLEQIRFNVNVDTATPILVDNNLAQAEIATDLRLLGTPYETGLSGTLTLLEGGEITLNERQYQIERGVITFLDERRIFPSFDLRLTTTASNYEIVVAVTGAPGETESSFTSQPTLPEPDIMALLITGRTLDEMRGEEYDIAREQTLSYLTGRVGSTLGRGLQRATGLSDVRIEPNLIANEADPGARLTVGQDITDGLELIYSSNLADSNDQIWVAQYDITRRFQTRAVRQSDNSYRLDFKHDVRFGGQPEPRRTPRQRAKIGAVQVPSDVEPGEPELRRLFGAKKGRTYDFFAIRRGVQRIERFYRDSGYLESRVRLSREQGKDVVNLTLTVSPGPRVDLQFEGLSPSEDVRTDVKEQWRRGVFDAQRIDDARETVRDWLRREHYLQPTIEVTADAVAEGHRQVTFRIDPGARSDRIVLVFQGVSQLDPDDLASIVSQQRLEPKLYTDPLVVTELLERYYREQGYLAAHIDKPRYEFEGTIARVVLEVQEGPRFTTASIAIAGNRVFDTDMLVRELPLVAGDPYSPAVAERSLERIRDLYWRKGYNDVRSDYELVLNRDRAEVQVTFTIKEGRQSVVAEVQIQGNERTQESLIRDELPLTPAEPLDLSVLGRSRKGLYDTGAFSIVDVTREDVTGAESSEPSSDANAPSDEQQKSERVRVAVREVQPFQIGYGASYDTERGVGGIFDVSNHNSLGAARVVGVRSRYDAQLREIRGYMSQPSLRSWPVQTTATAYYREERNPETTFANAFNFDRRGVSIQQEKQLGNAYVWSYGYRYERARTFSPVPGERDETIAVAPLTSTFTREKRDDVLDASTGSFTSHAFSFSPSWLGSDVTYVKYFAQYFHYIPLQPVRRKPLTNELLRPRLVYAVGVRLGLSGGFGGSVPSAERFFAGGSSTIRGFEQNAVGPIGADRIARGGEALFVLNNELRMPLISIVDGVIFADVGNAFARLRDFSFSDVRESAGVGLRLRTPWFLIRGDLGFPLDRRAGERRSRFYFSIGQAF